MSYEIVLLVSAKVQVLVCRMSEMDTACSSCLGPSTSTTIAVYHASCLVHYVLDYVGFVPNGGEKELLVQIKFR